MYFNFFLLFIFDILILITTFLSYLQILSYTPSNSWPLFHQWLLYGYMYLCVYICTHIYIPKYNLLCPFKVTSVYAFRTGHLTMNNYWCALPWGGPSLPLPALLSCCSSLCSLEASWAFPHPVWHVCWCPCLFSFISHLDSW